MSLLIPPDPIGSEALVKNLDLTKMDVVVQELFLVLEEAVKGYAGKERQARELLVEYHHGYRNWQFVVAETWRYATTNLRVYRDLPFNGTIVYLLSHILQEALESSQREEIRSQAADHLIALWLKLVDEMGHEMVRPMPEGVSVDSPLPGAGGRVPCHQGIPRSLFLRLARLPQAPFEDFMRSFYQIKKLAMKLLKIWDDPASFEELRLLLTRLLRETYGFWLRREDPCEWLALQAGGKEAVRGAWAPLCEPLTHRSLDDRLREIEGSVVPEVDHRLAVARLVTLPDFHEIVRMYVSLPGSLRSLEATGDGAQLGMLMRLKIMEIRGLEEIHQETLRTINFEVVESMRHKSEEDLRRFLDRIFEVLGDCMEAYPEGALQIVRSIGLEIIENGDWDLADFFLKRIISMGFQTPQLGAVSQYWQMEVNPAHLPNVRIWLEIIRKNPARTRLLLSALIVNLSLGGIYVRDTDLFQKDVSQLLHAPIGPVYNLVKQLAKLFPIYFNQIGAEGPLRAVSTDVDELTGRSDRLVHFLRKQSHVESSNVIVQFVEAIIEFWRNLDKTALKDLVPPEIYPDIVVSGPLVEEIHRIFVAVFESQRIHHVKDLLDFSEAQILDLLSGIGSVSDRERRRAFLVIQLYQLLHEKYALSYKDMRAQLQRAAALGLPDPSGLLAVLDESSAMVKLDAILKYLMDLTDVIKRSGELQIVENIYHKRHIAVDIPSMYGSYNERKFDALGLIFRLENLANVLFEEIIYSFDLSFITRATFFRISKVLPLFMRALAIDGITSNRLEMQAELFYKSLEVRRFSHSQYIDIFRGFSEAIKQIIHTHYQSVHEENLEVVVRLLGRGNLLPRYRRENHDVTHAEMVSRISESFLRDLIARTFGLQYFDHFISSILTTLATQREELSKEKLDLLLSYDPQKTLSYVCQPSKMTCDLIHLGNKGYNLVQLHALGIQVPPAFIITTEYFRCKSVIESFAQPSQDFRERVMEHIRKIEEVTGRVFGLPGNALLLSVRSGAAVSMPGMMNTFLNVGINERIVEGLVVQTGEAWFGWDNYRRFIQSWGMSFGMQRGEFDAIMRYFKKRYDREVKREFEPLEMRALALAYKEALKNHRIELSDDPEDQLFTAIRQVVASWYYPKAITYREIMGLSESWGTAVTVQGMVFGNLDSRSGAGVLFTHNPRTSEDAIDPNGDFTWGNQGEDVVGGLVHTLPISEKQRLTGGGLQEFSLESLFPNVYRRLAEVAFELTVVQNWAPQEIEFTFQGDSEEGVYILQSRNMAPRVRRAYPVFKPSEDLQASYVGSGIGVSGGALSGLVAFTLEHIEALRKEHYDQPIILLRSDTVPEDIHEISVADGILTGRGGATSHAAIVANRLGKTCVVGFGKMKIWERSAECVVDGQVLRTGDAIGIDGRSGAIYLGKHEIEHLEMAG